MDWQQQSNDYRYVQRPGGFVTASLVCGIVSLSLFWLGPLAIPVGALGILFAVLSRRLGRGMFPSARAGLIMSVIGVAIGILISVYSVYSVFTDPELREQYEQIMEYYYGTDPGSTDPGTGAVPETDLPSNVL